MQRLLSCSILAFTLICSSTASAQSFWDMEPQEVRDQINQKIMEVKADKPEVKQTADVTINTEGRSTPLRIYTPKGEAPFPIILLIHGGAWVAGNLDTHDNLARYLSSEVPALVVSVAYQNSPEGKFPLPLEQCYDALLWVVAQAQGLQGDSSRLAVVGDSAGGNMTAALCLLDRDRKGPAIDLQVLINPAPDLRGGGTLQRQGDELDTLRWYAGQYVSDANDVNNPYVSPMMAKSLANLPPALVVLAEKDRLRNDGKKYADRLIAAGVPTNIYIQWGIGHLAGDGARASLSAQESLDVAVAALRGALLRK